MQQNKLKVKGWYLSPAIFNFIILASNFGQQSAQNRNATINDSGGVENGYIAAI
jgi:hypothetical protein